MVGAWLLTIGAAWMIGLGLDDLLRGGMLSAQLDGAESEAVGPVVIVLVGAALVAERIWPAVPRKALARGHLVDAGYLGIYALVAPAVTLLGAGFALLVQRYARVLLLPRFPLLPRLTVVLAILVAIDGFNWAAHVANHKITVFWCFHALHHSQEEMSVLTTFRTHPLAHVSYLPAVLPALVLASSGSVPEIALVVYGCLATLPHANLRWSYGPLGRWMVSPAYHRLHHASTAVQGHPTVNFGFVLAVWDRLASTAAWPEQHPLIPTGLAGRPVPVEQDPGTTSLARVVARQLLQPLTPDPRD